MREILFRGKKIDGGEWAEGSLISFDNNTFAILKSKSSAYTPRNSTTFCSNSFYDIVPETIGQYTGLTDKDGKRIFEGDIVAFDAYSIHYVGVVTTIKGNASVKCESDRTISPFLNFVIDRYKGIVIGNIHDNPELLEMKK